MVASDVLVIRHNYFAIYLFVLVVSWFVRFFVYFSRCSNPAEGWAGFHPKQLIFGTAGEQLDRGAGRGFGEVCYLQLPCFVTVYRYLRLCTLHNNFSRIIITQTLPFASYS